MPRKKYYRRSDGLYETSRTINGKRVYFRGKSCAEVDRKIMEYDANARSGRAVQVIADEWLAQKEPLIAGTSYLSYARSEKFVAEWFGTRRAGSVRPLDVQRCLNDYAAKGYAKSTVGITLTVLMQVFSHAVLAGDTDTNPAREIKLPRGLPKKERHALTQAQELLVENCRAGEWWLLGVMLLYTGMRRGELLALHWQDVDLDEGVIHVTKKVNFVNSVPILETNLKSENGRRNIPILAPLLAVLPRERRIGLVWKGEKGGFMTEYEFYKAWSKYCEDAGLPFGEDGRPVITPHCLRHSFATIAYEAGIDPKTAASWLGDTEEVMRSVYEELRDAHVEKNAGPMNAYLELRRQDAAAL